MCFRAVLRCFHNTAVVPAVDTSKRIRVLSREREQVDLLKGTFDQCLRTLTMGFTLPSGGIRRIGGFSRALLTCVFFLLCQSISAVGQTRAATLAGKWVGSFDIIHPDGSVEPGEAYFSLVRNGEKVTGSAGRSATEQSPITSGKVVGDAVSLQVAVNAQRTVTFDLRIGDGRLKGSATGIPTEPGSRVVVDAQRADETWQTSAPTVHARDRLFETVAGLDRKLFDAYNTCDLDTLGTLVTDDLEFYHDKTGLEVGKKPFLAAIKNNICGKVQRVLISDSLEVYPLNGYGAVEVGRHRFHHPGREQEGVGEAKFVTIWRLKDGEWKITRVLSYDHAAARD